MYLDENQLINIKFYMELVFRPEKLQVKGKGGYHLCFFYMKQKIKFSC